MSNYVINKTSVSFGADAGTHAESAVDADGHQSFGEHYANAVSSIKQMANRNGELGGKKILNFFW